MKSSIEITLIYMMRDLIGLNYQSIVINNRVAFLLMDISLKHFIDNITRANSQVATSPETSNPRLLYEMGKLH